MSVKIVLEEKSISVPISEDLRVRDLNAQVAERMKIKDFCLKKDQVFLTEHKFVHIYLITRLTLINEANNVPLSINVNDVTFELEIEKSSSKEKVDPNISISELRLQILTILRKDQNTNCHLEKNNEILPDGDLLRNHIDEKTFAVVLTPFQVVFKMDQKVFKVNAKKEMTIREFKGICSTLIGTSVDDFVLDFDGNILEEKVKNNATKIEVEKRERALDKTLESHRIERGSTVNAIFQRPGGGRPLYF